MTHRGGQYKKDRVFRYLDLSFENKNHGNVPNQGLRPSVHRHGRVKGLQQQPATHSKIIHQTVDYHAQLETDIQHLLSAECADHTTSSCRTSDVTRQPTQSTEPTCYMHRGMAENKLEQQNSGYQHNWVAANKAAVAASGSGQGVCREEGRYVRPQMAHSYLMATEKRPRTASYSGEHRLGRPTRTSLLRARQRCNSAPITSYESRYEQQRRAKQGTEMKKQLNSTNQCLSDILNTTIPAGESLHSFLIGARYNSLTWIRGLSAEDTARAHHVDNRSMKECGVHAPHYSNSTTQSSFIIKKMKLKQKEPRDSQPEQDSQPQLYEKHPATASSVHQQTATRTPRCPPSSEQYAMASSNFPVHTKRQTYTKPVELQPSLVITPQPPKAGRQAWSEKPVIELNGNFPVPSESPAPSSVDVSGRNDGMGIKGSGFIRSPPKIARPMASHQRQTINRSSANGSAPSVMIQGRSIYNFNISLTPVSTPAITPNAVTRPKTSVGPQRELTARDVSEHLQMERQEEKKESASSIGVPVSAPINVPPEDPLSDESNTVENVEVMSTGSDDELGSRLNGASSPLAGISARSPLVLPCQEIPNQPVQPQQDPATQSPELKPEVSASMEKAIPSKESHSEGDTDRLTPIIANPKRAMSARSKNAHVHFADQINDTDLAPKDSPSPENQDHQNKDVFFMTEKGDADNFDKQLLDNQEFDGVAVVSLLLVDNADSVHCEINPEPTELSVTSPRENSADGSFNNGSGDCGK